MVIALGAAMEVPGTTLANRSWRPSYAGDAAHAVQHLRFAPAWVSRAYGDRHTVRISALLSTASGSPRLMATAGANEARSWAAADTSLHVPVGLPYRR